MLFKNKVDINSVQVGQWTKIIGTIIIDDETKNHRVIVEQLNILNKAKTLMIKIYQALMKSTRIVTTMNTECKVHKIGENKRWMQSVPQVIMN